MENFEECFFDDDYDLHEEQNEIEKIQSFINAKLILKNIEITKSSHVRKDLKKIVKFYINNFFKNKKDKNGLKISKSELYKKQNISNILNINIIESTKIIYLILEKYKKYSFKSIDCDVTNDIKLVNESLKKLYKAKVPQQFAGGMLLMYLKICKGVKIEI